MPLSDLYDSSFDGISFMELFEESGFAVEPDTGVEYSVVHIPGGSTTVVQSSGQAADTLDLPIGVMSAELASLRSKARSATRGTLVWHRSTGESARLMKVKHVRKAGHGIDGYKCQLEFVMG